MAANKPTPAPKFMGRQLIRLLDEAVAAHGLNPAQTWISELRAHLVDDLVAHEIGAPTPKPAPPAEKPEA
jgi:hypothetical protein